ncbi:MAG: TolC family protein, partial [Chitinispirillaceae bacterium]|nr:TolC family protein [Chitinispirillaceae bacterium]
EAVEIALTNNFGIMIARNDARVASVNNTSGNAGMLPTAAAAVSDRYLISSSSNALDASIALNWTVFDGFRMFVTKKKLGSFESLGELRYRDKVLATVSEVTEAYYDVVRQKQRYASFDEIVGRGNDLVNVLQRSFDNGLMHKGTLLQAQIDVNVFREQEIRQQAVIVSARRTLNGLLGRDARTSLEVIDSIVTDYRPDSAQLSRKVFEKNTTLLSYEKSVEISRLAVQELRGLRLPQLTLNAGYVWTQDNPATLASRADGASVGGVVTFPLFQAGNITRQVASAGIALQSAEINLRNAKIDLAARLQEALDEFENSRKLLEIESLNVLLAKENLEIATARLAQGVSTILELRQAQLSFVESQTRLIDIRYNLKIAETMLKRLVAEF